LIGVLGALVLVFLPGAWVSFGLRLAGLERWVRVLLCAMLSPIVTCLQFQAVRVLGASFEQTVPLLVMLNLPALCLVWRRFGRFTRPQARCAWAVALVLLIVFASMGGRFANTEDRIHTGHSWMHADITYSVADGELRPEDAVLAGVKLAYPWAGHIYLACLTHLLDEPLVSAHLWISLAWLLLQVGFVVGIASALGARGVAAVSAIAWLLLGTNFVGSMVMFALPTEWASAFPVWGDPRYTPWVFKFLFPSPMPFALGATLATTYLMVRFRARELTQSLYVVLFLLLAGTGIIYPIVAPCALALLGARFIAELVLDGRRVAIRPLCGLAAVASAALFVTVVHLRWVTEDRVTGPLEVSPPDQILLKAVTGLIVTLLLLAGLALTLRRCWRDQRGATVVLVVGGLANLALHAVVHIPNWDNEYKFIFMASICFAAFPALAMDGVFRRLGRWALAAVAALTLLLATPLMEKVYMHTHWGMPRWARSLEDPPPPPAMDLSSFDLRIATGERGSELCEAIRTSTAPDSILVSLGVGLHLPTLTRRHLYFPTVEDELYGINRTGDYIVEKIRGYDPELLAARRETLTGVFLGTSESRAQALEQLRALGRPVVLVLEVQPEAPRYGELWSAVAAANRSEANRRTADWLRQAGRGSLIYEGQGFVAWLVE
jgi:hypothetical protein